MTLKGICQPGMNVVVMAQNTTEQAMPFSAVVVGMVQEDNSGDRNEEPRSLFANG